MRLTSASSIGSIWRPVAMYTLSMNARRLAASRTALVATTRIWSSRSPYSCRTRR